MSKKNKWEGETESVRKGAGGVEQSEQGRKSRKRARGLIDRV